MRGINLGCGTSPVLLPGWTNIDAVPQKFKTSYERAIPGQEIGDINALEYQSNTFDVAASSHVLEHMDFPLMSLREWQRVLRPGGYLILAVPDGDCKAQWLGVHLATVEQASDEAKPYERHRADFTHESLLALFAECGGWASVEWIDPTLYYELPGKDDTWQLCVKAVKA